MNDYLQEGALVLIPNLLGANPRPMFADHPMVKHTVAQLSGIVAESSRGARGLLKRLCHQLPIEVMRKDLDSSGDCMILDLIEQGERWGMVTDAGWPAIADPGAALVLKARRRNLKVEICSGASSLLLALALCGLPSQSFMFHGYLPIQDAQLRKKMAEITRMQSVQSHLCIETPYRNHKLMLAMLEYLPSNWWLSICSALSLEDERVITLPISKWRTLQNLPQINRVPTVFVMCAGLNSN